MTAAIAYGLTGALGVWVAWDIRGRDMLPVQAAVWAGTLLCLAVSAVNFYVALR